MGNFKYIRKVVNQDITFEIIYQLIADTYNEPASDELASIPDDLEVTIKKPYQDGGKNISMRLGDLMGEDITKKIQNSEVVFRDEFLKDLIIKELNKEKYNELFKSLS